MSTGIRSLDGLLVNGYPSKSAILVEGPSGNEREVLAYRLLKSGLDAGDFCIYASRLSPSEVIEDASAFAIDFEKKGPEWLSLSGERANFSPGDLPGISFRIKELLKERKDRRVRIVFDMLPQLLLANSTESVYRFLGQLLEEIKRYDAVFLATTVKEVHQAQVLATIELLFDGVIEIVPKERQEAIIAVKKMRGVPLPSNQLTLALNGSDLAENSSEIQRQKIAVLPFVNMSTDANEEFFADGMTEEMISTLSNISGLAVISRTSIMQYKETRKSMSDIAKELKVGTVLEGSVRRAGKKVRVTVQLLDASEDKHLWSSSYDRELEDIFGVQSEIARSVAESLRVNVLESEDRRLQKKATRNSDAHLLYLRGRGEWNLRTPDSGLKALSYFQEAIQLDPSFALAHTGIADCYSIGAYTANLPLSVFVPKAKEEVTYALRLDDSLSEAHTSCAFILAFFERKWSDATEEFLRAIELNPSNVLAHQWYAELLQSLGLVSESLEEAKRGLELNPLDEMTYIRMGTAYYLLEQYDDAIEFLARVTVPLGEVVQAIVYAMKPNFDQALTLIQRAAPALPDRILVDLFTAYVNVRAGKADEGRKILEASLPAIGREHTASRYLSAAAFGALGDKDKMYEWLEKSIDAHELLATILIKSDPIFKEFRSDPRFQRLLDKMGILNVNITK